MVEEKYGKGKEWIRFLEPKLWMWATLCLFALSQGKEGNGCQISKFYSYWTIYKSAIQQLSPVLAPALLTRRGSYWFETEKALAANWRLLDFMSIQFFYTKTMSHSNTKWNLLLSSSQDVSCRVIKSAIPQSSSPLHKARLKWWMPSAENPSTIQRGKR